MERITREETRDLTDHELEIAHERILRDYCFGLLNDKVTPVENALLLEEELRKRGILEDDRIAPELLSSICTAF